MIRENLRATVIGFLAAVGVFALLFYFAGVDELVSTLTRAEPAYLALIVLTTLAWLVAWSFSLNTVLDVLGVELSYLSSFLVFAGATFSNNITPFGQAGGEPVTAYLISRAADAEYERSLAAIASVDTLNFVPSITIALVGAGYFASEVALGANENLLAAIAAVGGLAVVVPALIYAGWKRRYRLEARVIDALTPIIRSIADWIPRIRVPTPEGIERRINGFFRAIERIASNPRGLALALAASTVGWLCQMIGLWLAFAAIGVDVRLSIALIVVPIAAIAGVTPLPGGAGGIETVLVLLLLAAPLPQVTEPTAVAAVVIFRGAVYWIPTVIGGLVVGWIGTGLGISGDES
ncbi:lysylphosphatidylglycerol synthase transmembrane domain-containing protein [Halobellus captivus]|uniref:lysylphosphatidylglycerol synthase transmembrane domain-containing protein n=1 Tax=Halobellus captivus TaxID=2592614 RepID=UPI0011A53BFD|nr:lysylphosphatidylglycerol synthase transmembrane domain-containing protein [Halobellus captivus]